MPLVDGDGLERGLYTAEDYDGQLALTVDDYR